MILQMLKITCIVIFIVEILQIPSQIIESTLKIKVSKIPKFLLYIISKLPIKTYGDEIIFKPFTCSLCMTWWSLLIYIINIGEFNINGVFLISTFSFLSDNILNFLYLIKDALGRIYNILNDKIIQ